MRINFDSVNDITVLSNVSLLVLKLPYSFISERYFIPRLRRSPFVQQATPFQDLVIRCVRYAFANLPASIGRVFFSQRVAYPFFIFRLLRHGYTRSPITWHEVAVKEVRGLLLIHNQEERPDVVIYYIHGGGFSMGSAHFYLEPLSALLTLLKPYYRNPAVFALEYSLVPEHAFPVQLVQTNQGYDYVLSLVNNDASRICVAGDSAGATLILSLLLYIAKEPGSKERKPGYATLISPWVSLVSPNNKDTSSDFLNAETLHLYGTQYAYKKQFLADPLVSPGQCRYLDWWYRAAPSNGMYITFGSEEVLGPEARELIATLRRAGVRVTVREEPGLIHAWVIASLFLGEGEERTKGMKELAKMVALNVGAAPLKVLGKTSSEEY